MRHNDTNNDASATHIVKITTAQDLINALFLLGTGKELSQELWDVFNAAARSEAPLYWDNFEISNPVYAFNLVADFLERMDKCKTVDSGDRQYLIDAFYYNNDVCQIVQELWTVYSAAVSYSNDKTIHDVVKHAGFTFKLITEFLQRLKAHAGII